MKDRDIVKEVSNFLDASELNMKLKKKQDVKNLFYWFVNNLGSTGGK